MNMPSPRVRAYIYGIAVAALPILIAVGVVSKEDAPLWIAFAGAVLVPGLALANTPTSKRRNEHGHVDLAVALLGAMFLLAVLALAGFFR